MITLRDHHLRYTLAVFFATLLCLLTSNLWAAELTAKVSREKISIQDQLQVSFELRDASPEEPDFSPLQEDFEILAVSSGSRVISINNQTDRYYEWQLTLSPKRMGTLTIPAIAAAGARSQPVTIEVNKPSVNNSDAETFMQVEPNQQSVRVQQQFLVTLKLYSKVQWRNKAVQQFDLPGALVKAVAEDEYVSNVGGTPHLVYEVTLAVYPQKSGTLEFPSLNYEIEPAGRGRSLLSDFYGTGTRHRGRSEPFTIDVKPIPAENNGSPWLPAKQVTLSDHFSHDPEDLKAGEPITRRITLKAEGLSESQLPELELPEIEGINIYRDQAQTQETPSPTGLTSERTEIMAMVPSQEGRFVLPAVEVRWWNTETQAFETARLAERVLQVSLPEGYTPPRTNQPSAPVANSDSDQRLVQAEIPLWLIISQAVTAVLLLLFILLYWRSRQHALAPSTRATDLADGDLWLTLKQASAAKDLLALRRGLLAWFSHTWQEEYHSLDAVARACADPSLAEDLKALDRALYQKDDNTAFDSGALLQKIQKLRIAKRDRQESGKLSPLYPV